MTNKEYYKNNINQLIGNIKDDGCDFVTTYILSQYDVKCSDLACGVCGILSGLWLCAEHEEQQDVDWTQVPIDTLILCRDSMAEDWTPRYYAGYMNDNGRPAAFPYGATSKTNQGQNTISYVYNKLLG